MDHTWAPSRELAPTQLPGQWVMHRQHSVVGYIQIGKVSGRRAYRYLTGASGEAFRCIVGYAWDIETAADRLWAWQWAHTALWHPAEDLVTLDDGVWVMPPADYAEYPRGYVRAVDDRFEAITGGSRSTVCGVLGDYATIGEAANAVWHSAAVRDVLSQKTGDHSLQWAQ